MAETDFARLKYVSSIDEKYYNTLDIMDFFQMLKDPSYCYKYYWLEAIVHIICKGRTEAAYDEIIDEMIANAWYSVLEFHIHLSGLSSDGVIRDNLERAVLKLHELSELPANSSEIEIKNGIRKYNNALHAEKSALTINVPYKALSGFANKGEDRINLNSSAGRMIEYYNRLNKTAILLPYTFGTEAGLNRRVVFDTEWNEMIRDNAVAVLAWIQYEKVKWLQNNNPEVPGLIYKLVPMDERMRKLAHVRKLWSAILDMREINDVFLNKPIIEDDYDIDHFIPWSFTMNDELWNLMPMDSSLNSQKSNKLPVWKPFFEHFAENQYIMYGYIYSEEYQGIRKLYESCFKDNLHSIWANMELYRRGNSREEFYSILEKNMHPLYDSARRQGYTVWNCH